MSRRRAPAASQVINALTAGPYVGGLADLSEEHRVGRKRLHPTWLVFVYTALARHYRSYNRTDSELQNGLWASLRRAADQADLEDPGSEPFTYPHYSYWRDKLVYDPETVELLKERLTEIAVDHAQAAGLLTPRSGGSLMKPSPLRTIYGDGTVVRPMYRADPNDPDTKQGRVDPTAAVYHRHDGAIRGNNFVMFSVRSDRPGSRIVLAVERVAQPGPEADAAVTTVQRIVRTAGPGIQALVYDGALKGKHIDQIMRNTGLVVVNRPSAGIRGDVRVPKKTTLGAVSHPTGQGDCTHVLQSHDGGIVDVKLADDGRPVVVSHATRRQVKRARRKNGTYTFSMQIQIRCSRGDFTIWVSPHAKKDGDPTPERIRLLPPADPYFQTLYNLRNDAESINSQFKRSLLLDRAPSLGWERQLLDVIGFCILHNSLSWAEAIRPHQKAA